MRAFVDEGGIWLDPGVEPVGEPAEVREGLV